MVRSMDWEQEDVKAWREVLVLVSVTVLGEEDGPVQAPSPPTQSPAPAPGIP